MHNPSIMWTNQEAALKAKISFLIWDGSDGKSLGENYFDFPNNTVSLSRRIVTGFVARLGCDNRPGSKGIYDECGRCGGDGTSCRGCDNVTFSGAVIGKASTSN